MGHFARYTNQVNVNYVGFNRIRNVDIYYATYGVSVVLHNISICFYVYCLCFDHILQIMVAFVRS
eukprot:COSAG01_NODE_16642_length_1218_cov_2.503128_2_plen_65_part_00